MTGTTHIPHLLESCLRLPPEMALVLLTNVLNATTNWLVVRYLLSIGKNFYGDATDDGKPRSIVFVSFLRNWDFWRDTSRRIGYDLDSALGTGQLHYVDGLSKLFSSGSGAIPAVGQSQPIVLTDFELRSIETTILQALTKATRDSSSRPLLIIDGLDFLLASTQTTTTDVLDTLVTLREAAHSTVLSVSADGPLLHSQQTPLETEHTALVTSLLHQAFLVLSLRLLSTGVAKDVSGVIRISRGGGVHEVQSQVKTEEKEFLYLVAGDGSVKVFERGTE